MRILLSAYACEPDKGSEPEVGYRALLAAARAHDVWVLTRANNIPMLDKALAAHPTRDRIHLVGFDVPGMAYMLKRRGLATLHWYYDVWQREAGARALELDRQFNFDVLHHVTFATYCMRVGIAPLGKPLVWGPVGGAVVTPARLWSELGLRGIAEDLARVGGRFLSACRPSVQRTQGLAELTLAQNREAARRLERGARRLQILPNASCVLDTDLGARTTRPRSKEIALVGRLIAWKGGALAIRALKHVRDPGAMLTVYGDGPERARMERRAALWGLRDRVSFIGTIPREQLLRRLAASAVLLHPALHDDSPLTVAESLSLGTPVVSLDRGGPATIGSLWPEGMAVAVRPGGPEATAQRLARAIDDFLANPAPGGSSEPLRHPVSFAESLLAAYETVARCVSTRTPNAQHAPQG
jgi:glycosyltransferase involved in cell wall biosynthesis